jgi:predicted aspartyl protease
MGVFRVTVEVFSLQDPERRQEVEMVVDTGAFRTVIPRAIADALGVKPEKRQTFRMINGEPITRDLGWVGVSLHGDSAHTLAILGEPDDHTVLGALTLEELTLEVDPTRGQLRPMQDLLLLAVG